LTSFIHVRKNALSKDVCNSFINLFEKRTELHIDGVFGTDGVTVKDENIKSSTDITFSPKFLEDEDFGPYLNENIVPCLQDGLRDYERYYYLAMDNIDEIGLSLMFNMQRYKPGGGYKIMHCERASNQFFPRTHAWMIYLNDVEIGGETEFFYQQHFERAEAGKLCIWPADFTHVHRGIVAPNETKYILTGWYQFIEPLYSKIVDDETGAYKDDTFELSAIGMMDKYHPLYEVKDKNEDI
tara:strand:- start:3006 stop:3725 length:720 start_codon:yes stop_codon:yes gene_type:complete